MSTNTASRFPTLMPTTFSSGALQLLKLLGVALMTLDHINSHLWAGSSPLAFNLGRLAMPIFALVFAFNLARPGALERAAFQRLAMRLSGYGLLATIPYALLNGAWPVNILLTLLMAAVLCLLLQRGQWHFAALSFAVGGLFVEYLWFGMALVVAAWWYFKQPTALRMTLLMLVWAGLVVVNGNHWALAAIPLVSLLSRTDLKLPRLRRAFYVYYPAHLALICLASSSWPAVGGIT